MPVVDRDCWKSFFSRYSSAHILQSDPWGELKSIFGWQVSWVVKGEFGAQVMFRSLPMGYHLAYIPKGPIGLTQELDDFGNAQFIRGNLQDWKMFWSEIDQLCHRRSVVFLKVEPDIWEKPEHLSRPPVGFQASPHAIQPPRTILVNLDHDENQLLNQMKQKTRYNIRLAEKRGIEVHPSRDIDTFYQLVTSTGKRDKFEVHNLEYYRKADQLFHPRGECELFIAQYMGTPLAGLMVFSVGKRAWYFYGGSSEERRDLMPTYLLQWEAIRWARLKVCVEYDLWGVPDAEESILERDFLNQSQGLWGVYRYKRGFGGCVRRSVGAWDRVYNHPLYLLYRIWMKRHMYLN